MRSVFDLLFAGLCHGLLYAWLVRAFPWLAARRKRLAAALVVVVVAIPVARLVVYRFDAGAARVVTALVMAELIALVLALGPLTLIRLVAHLHARREQRLQAAAMDASLAGGKSSAPLPEAPSHPAPRVSRRVLFERTAGLAVLGASGGTVGWGVVRGRLDFQLEEVVVKIRDLPRALEGYSIVQVSDLHVGLFVREAELARGLSLVRGAKPDLIVATGDLVDFDPRYIGLMARSLGDLGSLARDGVAAILGNHDYYTDGIDVAEGLRAAGVRTLINEHAVLRPKDAGGIVLAGVDDYAGPRFAGVGPDLARALRDAPDGPRILLAHQPRFFDEAAGKVALQLSGHVHGGQVNPGFRPASYVLRYVAGRYQASGSTMWVNRGFGTAGPPTRVGAPPEVTKIVLVAG